MSQPVATVRGEATLRGRRTWPGCPSPSTAPATPPPSSAGRWPAASAEVGAAVDPHARRPRRHAPSSSVHVAPVFARQGRRVTGYRGSWSTQLSVADFDVLGPPGARAQRRRPGPAGRPVVVAAAAEPAAAAGPAGRARPTPGARADDYAAAFGATVVDLLEVSDLDGGGRPGMLRQSFAMAKGGPPEEPELDLEPAAQTVTGQVTVRFALSPAVLDASPERRPAGGRRREPPAGPRRRAVTNCRIDSRACSPRCWSPTAVRSPSAPSVPPTSSGRRPSRSTRTRTATRCTGSRPTRPTMIGERGHPVRAYLDIDEIIRAARESGADAVYPGYGFLSENPDLARACDAAGITFIGPPADVLQLAGNKVRALAAAKAAGIPTLRSTPPSADLDELVAGAEEIGFPVFVKAVAGGGGRGMRRVDDPAQLRELGRAPRCARPRAPSATRPRSSSRPSAGRGTSRCRSSPTPRARRCTCSSATARSSAGTRRSSRSPRRRTSATSCARRCAATPSPFAESIDYSCAGTVEFLVETEGERAGQHVFIEMNPRIQVEHTVTEEITDVDLVQSQMRIASGESLADLGPGAGRHPDQRRRAAVPDHHRGPGQRLPSRHRHDHRLPLRRRRGRPARRRHRRHRRRDQRPLRLDAGQADLPRAGLPDGRGPGARGRWPSSGSAASAPTSRSCRPCSRTPTSSPGNVSTAFIEERPQLLTTHAPGRPRHPAAALAGRDHGQQAERRGADAARPGRQAARRRRPRRSRPRTAPGSGCWSWARRASPPTCAPASGVEVTDTTFRDAHQSLLATRVRTKDLLRIAPYVGRMTPELLSVECWGGATYDVALRFLAEDPWERLAALRYNMPGLCLQMLLRGRNTVGYTPYPTKVTTSFVAEAAAAGHRHLPDLRRPQRRRPDAAGDRGGPRDRHDGRRGRALLHRRPQRTRRGPLHPRLLPAAGRADRRRRRARAGHQGHGRACCGRRRRRSLVTALRERFDLPVHLHTHDTAGGQLATLLAAVDAGVDAVDVASAPMAGTTSQPPASALVAALEHTERATNLDLRAVMDLEPYWEAVRKVYAPFESGPAQPDRAGLRPRDPRRPAVEPAPAGDRAGAGGEVRADRGHVRRGQPHPRPADQGDAVVQGGRRPRPAPGRGRRRPGRVRRRTRRTTTSPTRSSASSAASWATRPAAGPSRSAPRRSQGRTVAVRETSSCREEDSAALDEAGRGPAGDAEPAAVPRPDQGLLHARETYGNVARLDTLDYLYGLQPGEEHVARIGRGVSLILGLEAIGDADERGMRTVMCTINGQLRPIRVRDTSIKVDVKAAEKADPTRPGPGRRAVRRRGHRHGRRGRRRSRPAPRWPRSRR